MRILILSNLYPPHVLGGYEILCGQVVERLAARGHEIRVLTTDHGLRPGEGEESGGEVPVSRSLRLYLPFHRKAGGDRWRKAVTHLRNQAAAARFLGQWRPDVVFVWSQLRLTLGPARAAEETGLPVVYTFNDEHPAGYLPAPFSRSPKGFAAWVRDRFLLGWSTLRTLRLDRATCISRLLRDNLQARGVRPRHTRVIYQGIPVERFPCKDEPGSIRGPSVLYVGQLHDYKGVHHLVEAVHRGASEVEGLRLSVAGAGPPGYEERLRDLAARGPAPVEFLGKVPHADLPALYRAHDLFAFPSVWQEPFGLTHLEAMASGTPVVSTAEGGQGEFLRHEVNSLVVPPADEGALAAALVRLARDPELARRLALAAREEVARDFSLDRYVRDLEAWLGEALPDSPRGAS